VSNRRQHDLQCEGQRGATTAPGPQRCRRPGRMAFRARGSRKNFRRFPPILRVAAPPRALLCCRYLSHSTESFAVPAFIDLLHKHDVAMVCADTVEWPCLVDVTSDFVYCRLHGSEELYASGYDDAALDMWATRAAEWARRNESPNGDRVRPPGGIEVRRAPYSFISTMT
jgi:uncharacterized protein YecE (DUF72 family)